MKSIANKIHEGLATAYSDGEIKALTRIIATELLGIPQMTFFLKDDVTLTAEQQTLLGNAIERLKKQEPIQYILGYSDFCGLRFKVTPATPTLLDRIQSNFPGLFADGHVISSFHVKRGKPYPDPYLLALERGGFAPNEVIVVENAPLGVTAGVAAGLFTVAANTGPLKDEVLTQAGANLVFPSIEALCNEWEKLFEVLK